MKTEIKAKAGMILIPKPEYFDKIKTVFNQTTFTVTKEHELSNATIGDMWKLKNT